jgi:hypothetical protein
MADLSEQTGAVAISPDRAWQKNGGRKISSRHGQPQGVLHGFAFGVTAETGTNLR